MIKAYFTAVFFSLIWDESDPVLLLRQYFLWPPISRDGLLFLPVMRMRNMTKDRVSRQLMKDPLSEMSSVSPFLASCFSWIAAVKHKQSWVLHTGHLITWGFSAVYRRRFCTFLARPSHFLTRLSECDILQRFLARLEFVGERLSETERHHNPSSLLVACYLQLIRSESDF